MPVCAEWLKYAKSVPDDKATGVVMNSSISIRFSNAVKDDPENFKKNIKITQGDKNIFADSTDITDRFDMSLGAKGLILTCKLKSGSENLYEPKKEITVNISSGLEGANKNTFTTAKDFSFVAGGDMDDYAPDIKVITAGIKDKYAGINPSTSVDLSTQKTQRVKDKMNIYVYAVDKTEDISADEDEMAVSSINVRSSLVIDSEGTEIPTASQTIEKSSDGIAYLVGTSFVDGVNNSSDNGTVFEYDLGSGEDGLVRVDVAVVDNVGNANGFDSVEGSNKKYKSLFVVRDTTPPNIETEKSKVKLQSSSAKYSWFNESSLGSVKAGTTASIEDGGSNVNLRAPDDKMKWAFTLSGSSSWTPEDDEWKLATEEYPLNAGSPREGKSDVYMMLQDDLGNKSAVAKLPLTLNFDKTSPALGTPSWVNDSGSVSLGITKNATIGDYLSIPFTETLSGVREIDIKLGGSSVIDNNTEFFYSASAITDFTSVVWKKRKDTNGDYSILDFTTVSGDPTEGYKSGILYVKGINLGSAAEGECELSVVLNDAAINHSDEANPKMIYDKTSPELKRITFPQIKQIYRFGETNPYYFIGSSLFENIEVELLVEETTSGIRTIDFSEGSVIPTANSVITVTRNEGGTDIVTNYSSGDFTVSDNGIITFKDNLLGKINHTDDFSIKISKCKITLTNGANPIAVSLTDFAGRNSDKKEEAKYYESSIEKDTYSKIYANNLPSPTPAITLSDRGTDETETADLISAQTGYTNYKVVNGKVTVDVAADTNDFIKFQLTDGAVFTSNTVIPSATTNNGGTLSTISLTLNTDYEFDSEYKTLTFKKSFGNAVEFDVTNIELTGTAGGTVADGLKTVKAKTLSSSDTDSTVGTSTITLDTKAPVTTGVLSHSTDANDYPRIRTTSDEPTPGINLNVADKNKDDNNIYYFYTSGDSRTFDLAKNGAVIDSSPYYIKIVNSLSTSAADYKEIIKNTTTAYKTEFDGVIENGRTIDVEADTNLYSYILYDKAGNISPAYSFYLIKDNTAQTVDDNKITPTETATAHFFKNAANTTDHTRTYIIKQTTDEYKIVVNLDGYAEKLTNATHSGLAQWAITSGTASPAWQNYNSSQNSGNIEYFINSVTSGEKLTLHLKDNCGNTKTIDIKDSEDSYANTILWTVDGTAPSVEAFYPLSTRTSLTVGNANASDDEYGSSFWKNNPQTTYYNDDAALGVKYSAETCLYSTANATETATDNYTVKARLYFTLDTSETVNENTFDTATERLSPWYYFADVSGGRTFFVPYPTRPEGTQGKLYLLLEDKVGNKSVTQVTYKPNATSNTIDKFVYINHPPRIVSGASDYDGSNIPLAPDDYYVSGSTVYVNGSEGKVPSFNIDLTEYATIRENITGSGFDIYYLYSNDGDLDWASAKPTGASAGTTIASSDNLSETFNKKVPVDLLNEASTSATPKELYLYVRDVVGNNQKKQLGSGKKYLKDSAAPEANGWAVTNAPQSNSGNSNIKQIEDSGEIILEIMLAASSSYFNTQNTAGNPYTVLISKDWFTDNDGSGVKGLLESSSATLGSDLTDGGNFKLTIPYDTYKESGGTHSGTFYAYDNVGNKSTAFKYKTIVDSTPPDVSFDLTSSSGLLYSDSESLSLSENNTKASTKTETNSSNTADTAPKIWSSDSSVKITVIANDTNGIASVKVDGSDASSAVTLTAGNSESLHTVVVTDNAGNTTTLYFKLQLDTTAPTFENPTATPNTGARIKEVSGTKTLYYNSLTLSAKISDSSGVGLDSYKKPEDTDYTSIAATDIVDKKFSFTATESAGNDVTVYAKDKLENVDSVSAWKVGTETISAFVFDNTKPSWSASPISVVRNGFINVGNSKTWNNNTSDFISYNSDTKKVLVKSNLDANIIITPSATDTSEIVGYIANTTGTTPNADSTTAYPTQFLLACGIAKTTAFVDTIKKTIPTGTTAAATDANFNLKLAKNESLTVYFFPVDYAGNVGTAQEVTFAYEENIPVVDGTISVDKADGFVIYPKSNINYFRGVEPNAGSPDAATGEDNTGVQVTATITLKDPTTFPLKGFKLIKPNGTQLAYHTYAGTKSDNKFNLPYNFSSYNGDDDIYIVFYNAAGDSEKHSLTYNGVSKWREDVTAPNRPTAVTQVKSTSDTRTFNDGSNGFYLDTTANKLYYNNSATTAYLNFTVTDEEANTSDIKGVGTSTNLDSSGTIANPYVVDSTVIAAATGGKQKFYAYDNVLNYETTGLEITYIKDIEGPVITDPSGTPTITAGVYKKDATHTYYKPGNSITINVGSVTDEGCGVVKGYKYSTDGGTTETDVTLTSNTFTLTGLTGNQTISVYAYDILNNKTKIGEFSIIADAALPTIANGAVTVSTAAANHSMQDDSDIKKYYFNATKKNATDYNVDKITFTVDTTDETIKASDSGSGIASYSYSWNDGDAVEKKVSDGSANVYELTLNGTDYTTSKTMKITAKDNVGNVSEVYAITIVPVAAPTISGVAVSTTTADYLAPDGTKKYFFNAAQETGTSDYNVPSITFTVTASSSSTGIAIDSYSYNWNGTVQTGTGATSSSYTHSLSDTDYSTSKVMKITATDKLGNVSDEYEITLVPDWTTPTINVATFTSGGTEITDNIHDVPPAAGWVAGDTWKTKSGGTVYFKNSLSPKITFTATDTGSSASETISVTVTNGDSISRTDGDTTTVTAKAKDKVGNESTFTIDFIADGDAPTITVDEVTGNATGCLYDSSTNKFYFNSTTDPNKISSITITTSTTDTDIASYSYDVGGTVNSETTSTLTLTDLPSSNTPVTINATDNVGNTTITPIAVTLVPDANASSVNSYAFDASAKTLTLSCYPLYKQNIALKSITFGATGLTDATKDSVAITGQTTTNTLASNVLTLTFDSDYALTGSSIVISLPDGVTVTGSVSVKNADNENIDFGSPSGASLFSMARNAANFVADGAKTVVSGVKTILGASAESASYINIPSASNLYDIIKTDIADTLTDANNKTDEIAPITPNKKSAKKSKKKSKSSVKENLQQVQGDINKTNDTAKSNDILRQTDLNDHSEFVSESLESITESIPTVEEQNIPLAENKIIEYNAKDDILENDSSQAAKAIVAIAIAVLACITLGIILLLKRKRIK